MSLPGLLMTILTYRHECSFHGPHDQIYTHDSQLELKQGIKQQARLQLAEGPINWKASMKSIEQELGMCVARYMQPLAQ